MKKAILTLLAVLAVQATTVARAEDPTTYTVVLAGGATQNQVRIWLTSDGYNYVIDSAAPLEVGGSVCEVSSGNANELICKAPLVAGFVVVASPHDDSAFVAAAVNVPVTMLGGAGRDKLIGGSGGDKLIGGSGADWLSGKAGNDLIFGGPGEDVIKGGGGNDTLRGGPGNDHIGGGSGTNSIHQRMRSGF